MTTAERTKQVQEKWQEARDRLIAENKLEYDELKYLSYKGECDQPNRLRYLQIRLINVGIQI